MFPSLFNDPFFDDYDLHVLSKPLQFGPSIQPQQQQQQLTSGQPLRQGKRGSTGGQLVANPRNLGTALTAPSFWDWDRTLAEPLSLGMDDMGDHYVMDVRRPHGLTAKDLKLELQNDLLTVHGEKQTETRSADGKSVSTSSTAFSRSIRLPEHVDASKITAKYVDNGKRLHIELPKVDEELYKPKQIAIEGADTLHLDKEKKPAAGSEERKTNDLKKQSM